MQSRIKCVPCGNRVFSNREALQQHLKTSSSYHPLCEICDKRFSSESGLEAHKTATHPPTYDCTRCGRSFAQIFALEDHFRGSPNHPNCLRCGKGFKDMNELETHRNTAHRQIPCARCNGELVYEDQDSQERHYSMSEQHPNCPNCGKGCADDSALATHIETAHTASATGDEAAVTNVDSPATSLSPLTNVQVGPRSVDPGPLERVQVQRVVEADDTPPVASTNTVICPTAAVPQAGSSPSLPTPANVAVSPPLPSSNLRSLAIARNASFSRNDVVIVPTSTGFTPLSPNTPSYKDLTILGAARTDTPDLRLSMAFSSPLLQVQPLQFSPIAGLAPPNREMNELWNSTKNIIQATTPVNGPSQIQIGPPPPQQRIEWKTNSESCIPRERSSSQSTTSSSSYSSPNSLYQTSSTSSYLPSSLEPRHTRPTASRIPRGHGYSSSLTSLASSTMNLSTTASHLNYAPPGALVNGNGYTNGNAVYRHPGGSPPRSVVGSTRSRYDSPSRASTISAIGPPGQELLPRNLSPPFQFNDSRLYPGLARTTLRSSTITSSPTNSTRHGSGYSTYVGPSTPPRIAESGRRSWRQVETEDHANVFARTLHYLMPDDTMDGGDGPSGLDEFDSATPKLMDSPKKKPDAFMNIFESPDGNLSTDTLEFVSGESESEPEASEAGVISSSPSDISPVSLDTSFHSHQHCMETHCAKETGDLAENAASVCDLSLFEVDNIESEPTPEWFYESETPGPLPAPAIAFSLSYESTGLRSPDVASPIGLAMLPSMSPLLHTPIDLVTFEWPESKIPLPDSCPASPPTSVAIFDIESPRNLTPEIDLHPEVIEEVEVDTNKVETPFELVEEDEPVPETTAVLVEDEVVTIVNLDVTEEETPILPESDPEVQVAAQTPLTKTVLPPLHCRECKANECDDITATMCGHLFCNRCIVNAVIKTSRCPLCSTPTLLYCLFRLDLETS